MRLCSISVRNYRSIAKASELNFGNYTVLIGPNNEGKSNILNAIALSLKFFALRAGRPHIGSRYSNKGYFYFRPGLDYNWERDFPVSLQTKTPNNT